MKKYILLMCYALFSAFLISCSDELPMYEATAVCSSFSASEVVAAPPTGYVITNTVWQIYNEDGLKAFRDHINGTQTVASASSNAVLLNDITLSENWVPIGNESRAYIGSFNGNFKNISGLVIDNTSNYQGLFGNIGGGSDNTTIQNLAIVKPSINALNYVGSVVGYVNSNTIIDNVRAVGGSVVVRGDELHVGGVAGFSYATLIDNSCNSNTVDGEGYRIMVGGVVGSNYGNQIVRSFNTGNVYANGDNTRGGGVVAFNQVGEVIGCFNSLNFVGGNNELAGGVVGANGGKVIASYNLGDVTGGFSAGGVVGYNFGTVISSYNVAKNIRGRSAAPGAVVGSNNIDSASIEGVSFYLEYENLSAFGSGTEGNVQKVSSVEELNSKISVMNDGIPIDKSVNFYAGTPDRTLHPPIVK